MGVLATAERNDVADALRRAAELLRGSRLPVIGGLRTDIAGAEAAISLAKALGGVIDHEAGEGLSRGSAILRSAGGCPASFGEVRNRADLVVLIGRVPTESDAQLVRELFPAEPGLPRPGDNPRELVLIGADDFDAPAGIAITAIAVDEAGLPTILAGLAADLAESQARPTGDPDGKLSQLAGRLRKAAFPVLVYSPAELEEPLIQIVLEIVRRLCVKARAAAFSLPAPGNGIGVNLCAIWTTGLPVRTRFAVDGPRHDAFLYATDRLIASGDADALVWIDALDGEGPPPPEGIRMVEASKRETTTPTAAEVLNRLLGVLSGGEAR
jgi:formylmethanofuran dehydrogenase subunit B